MERAQHQAGYVPDFQIPLILACWVRVQGLGFTLNIKVRCLVRLKVYIYIYIYIYIYLFIYSLIKGVLEGLGLC